MQNTRISSIVNISARQLSQWSQQPWRRSSLIFISLLLGFFLASVISTSTGARSELDIVAAALVALFVEIINRFVYSPKRRILDDGSIAPRRVTIEMLNSLKLGITYGLFLEAFKLGS